MSRRQLNAFERYLLSLPPREAILHVYECLRNGEGDNQAWELMARINGPDWKCPPDKIMKLIGRTIHAVLMEDTMIKLEEERRLR